MSTKPAHTHTGFIGACRGENVYCMTNIERKRFIKLPTSQFAENDSNSDIFITLQAPNIHQLQLHPLQQRQVAYPYP